MASVSTGSYKNLRSGLDYIELDDLVLAERMNWTHTATNLYETSLGDGEFGSGIGTFSGVVGWVGVSTGTFCAG